MKRRVSTAAMMSQVRTALLPRRRHPDASAASFPMANAVGSAIEALESRTLLSAAPTVSAAMAQKLSADGFVSVEWKGHQVFAQPGQWVLDVNGVTGGASAELGKINALLATVSNRLHATRYLGAAGMFRIEGRVSIPLAAAEGALSKLPGFVSLEPNFAMWAGESATDSVIASAGSAAAAAASVVPNDPYFSQYQWDLNNTGQTGGAVHADINALNAWNTTTGNGSVVVGVIDTGIDYTHPDLAANMWTNPFETAGDSADNDGNGFVDDIHGANFVNHSGNPADDRGHGTHVAGTIAAVGNNGLGVAGINWNAKLMALKFLDASGNGTGDNAIAAINYAISMKQRGVNLRVLNASWGGGDFSATLSDAIKRAGDNGMLFVAAAGNSAANNDTANFYPANYSLPNEISVAATDSNDQLASFSNYGANSVQVAAPGVGILSTYPGNQYASLSGTSMAAPHVVGVAALAFAANPNATYQQVKSAILNGVDRVPALAGKTTTGGRLSAYGTLQQFVAPVAPTNLQATITGNVATLTWSSAAANAIGYRVERSTDNQNFTEIGTTTAKTYTDNAAPSGTLYYRVRAYDTMAASLYSNVVTPTPVAPPAPTSAAFVSVDATTAGSWQGVYGAQGADLIGSANTLPSYATLTPSGASSWTWAGNTSELRALSVTSGGRIAATLYSSNGFNLGLNLTDGQHHKVSLYLLDWDNANRAETIDVLNASTGQVLATQSVSGFAGGKYVSFDVAGNVTFRISRVSGINAVVSGIFVDAPGTTIPTPPPPPPPPPAPTPTQGQASFLFSDGSTQGNWQGAHGAQGSDIIGATNAMPSYATVTPSGASAWTWAANTNDPRALSTGSGGRIASTLYAASSFDVGLNLSDGQHHQISMYLLDWDAQNRSETIDVLDAASGQVLASQSVSGFSGGKYLAFDVAGSVTFRLHNTGPLNAVLSGLFVDPAGTVVTPPPPPPPVTPPPTPTAGQATFLTSDANTKGNWQGAYGGIGADVIGGSNTLPSYAVLTPSGASSWTWAAPTADPRAPFQGPGSAGRVAATLYASTSFDLGLNLTDGNHHRVSLYLVDWDSLNRAERVDVLDTATGRVLATHDVSGFSGGQYLTFDVAGNVTFRFRNVSGINAVLSGMFIDT